MLHIVWWYDPAWNLQACAPGRSHVELRRRALLDHAVTGEFASNRHLWLRFRWSDTRSWSHHRWRSGQVSKATRYAVSMPLKQPLLQTLITWTYADDAHGDDVKCSIRSSVAQTALLVNNISVAACAVIISLTLVYFDDIQVRKPARIIDHGHLFCW